MAKTHRTCRRCGERFKNRDKAWHRRGYCSSECKRAAKHDQD